MVEADACPVGKAVVLVHQRGDGDPFPSSRLVHGWIFTSVMFS